MPHELTAKELDGADWRTYLEAEDKIFLSVRANVTGKLRRRNRSPTIAILKAAPSTPDIFHKIGIDHTFSSLPELPAALRCFCMD